MAARERFEDSGEAAPVVASSMMEVVFGAITVRAASGIESAALKRVLRVVRSLA